MFESSVAEAPALTRVRALTAELGTIGQGLNMFEQMEMLRALEELKCASAGAQAAVTADFAIATQQEREAADVPARDRKRGLPSQVAFARRVSPARGQHLVGFATVVRREMPFTYAALIAGKLTERAAMGMVQETACVELPVRTEVDQAIAGDLDVVEGRSEKQIINDARAMVAKLDPAAVAERRRRAEADRAVTTRPAPDTMMWLTTLMPVKQGVSVYAVLSRDADQKINAGDERTRGQIMTDTLAERVLAGEAPDAAAPTNLPLMINVIVPDSVLLGDDDGGGWVEGYGPVPGDLLREWIAQNEEVGVEQFVRRLYVSPKTGELVAMDSKATRFEGKLAEYLRLRDLYCRTPYCGARIRHLDHVRRKADGGPTTAHNGQGTCVTCNQAKEGWGWSARPIRGPDGEHLVETVMPTGHSYISHPPRWTIQERGLRDKLFGSAA